MSKLSNICLPAIGLLMILAFERHGKPLFGAGNEFNFGRIASAMNHVTGSNQPEVKQCHLSVPLANIRAGASTSSKVVAYATPATNLKVVGLQGKWIHTEQGYISKRLTNCV